MIDTVFTVDGAKEIANKLQKFPVQIEKKILRNAMRFGLERMKKDAQALAPKGSRQGVSKSRNGKSVRVYFPGNLKASIRHGVLKRRDKSAVIAMIYTDSGSRARHDGFYGRFVEKGTKKMQGRHFMRSALNANAQDAINRTAEHMRQTLEKLEI